MSNNNTRYKEIKRIKINIILKDNMYLQVDVSIFNFDYNILRIYT